MRNCLVIASIVCLLAPALTYRGEQLTEEEWAKNYDFAIDPDEPLLGMPPEIRFDEASLTDAVEFMRDVSGLNIVVDWPALRDAGVEADAPLHLKPLAAPTIVTALDAVLGSAGSKEPPGLVFDSEFIRISAAAQLERERVVRVYEVADLLANAPEAPKDARIGSAGELRNLIQSKVAPAAWKAGGVIREFDGRLVISASELTHRRVAEFLEQLRETVLGRVPVRVAVKVAPVNRAMLADKDIKACLGQPLPGTAATGVMSEDQVVHVLRLLRANRAAMWTTPLQHVYSGDAVALLGDGSSEFPLPVAGKPGKSNPILDLKPTVAEDRQSVQLRIWPRVRRMGTPQDRIVGDSEATVTLPRSGFVLVAMPEAPEKPGPAGDDDTFYLFVVRAQITTARVPHFQLRNGMQIPIDP
ncbi:MAG: hypothetical protein ACHRHE_01085 [Tepidisphaerales bacterium]